jgi:hypothetical protein
MSELGAMKGGNARAAALSPEERSEIARNAVNARWAKTARKDEHMLKATHMGELQIGELSLPCAVLEDGTRMVASAGVMKALGRPWRGKYKSDEKPNFLAANNLEPYIATDLRDLLEPIEYNLPQGGTRSGYRAELLPKVCEVYLQARDAGTLLKNQERAAIASDVLIRGLAQVGIIALVDEATGYQDYRAKKALQEILEQFIARELRPWVKTFPDDFYRQIFRLNKWQYRESSIKRPGVIGRWTNNVIYDRLAPGVRQEIQNIVARDAHGRPRNRLFQHLTDDIGHPKLREHIASVTVLMKAADTWIGFIRLLDKALPRYDTTLKLPIDDE